MSHASSFLRRAWIAVPLLALGFLSWSYSQRVARVLHVTDVVPAETVVSAVSPTGYAGGIRELIVPEQNYVSSQWIAQTQQMLAQGEWRVRRIDYENAPLGREILTPSPYRWWLGLVAWIDHVISGRPLGLSVERAALFADFALHVLLLLGAVMLVAWRFGRLAASLLSIGLVFIFPFAAGFLPGIPDDRSLSRSCAFFSVLVLLAGIRPARKRVTATQENPRVSRRNAWFFASGVIGGFGLWVNVADQVPVIAGLGVGALLATWVLARRHGTDESLALLPSHWLVWSLGGAASSLGFYLIEYFPGHLGSWHLREIHPVYSFAWIGLGLALKIMAELIQKQRSWRSLGTWMGSLLALACMAAVPVASWKTADAGFLAMDVGALRLTQLQGSAEAASVFAWLSHDGLSVAAWVTFLPVLLLIPAIWLISGRSAKPAAGALHALAMGPVLVTLGFACWRISHWNNFDAALLVFSVAITVAVREMVQQRVAAWIWALGFGLVVVPGVFQLKPPAGKADRNPLSESELAGLIARDLAHWLAKHTDASKAVILAPPNETTALYYYGGLRGLGTVAFENQIGTGAAARIFSATTPIEASVRTQSRSVTHIIVPSWDRFLNEYVQLSDVQLENSFLSGLRNWAPIPWLRPLPYQLPAVPGYEDQSVAVFEVVTEQNEATILSWQAEYFAESGQLDYAGALSKALQRFPADLGALIARGQVAMVRRDASAVDEVVKALLPRLKARADNYLPWDRRIRLAAVLAQGKQTDLAKEQVRRCLADLDEKRLRSASTGALYRLLVLVKLFGLEIENPALRSLATDLLPADWRARL